LNQYGRQIIGTDGQPEMAKVLFPALYHAHIDLSKNGDATGARHQNGILLGQLIFLDILTAYYAVRYGHGQYTASCSPPPTRLRIG
jgi:hypothetical protein